MSKHRTKKFLTGKTYILTKVCQSERSKFGRKKAHFDANIQNYFKVLLGYLLPLTHTLLVTTSQTD